MNTMNTTLRRGLASVVLACVTVASGVATAPPASAVGAEGEGWPSFSESDGCGSPWMRGPKVEFTGSLPGSTLIRGPFADYFGRTASELGSATFWWDVPMSNGETLRLSDKIAPALAVVETGFAEAEAADLSYLIRKEYTFAFTSRTIGGSNRVSQHAFGNSLDINSIYNPYSSANILITDFPDWFVDIWRDAGYCWGGNWINIKDAMHYNWKGPIFTPGFTELPPSTDPLTTQQGFTRTMHTADIPAAPSATHFQILMDGDLDGGIDVVNVVDSATGTIIDIISANEDYKACRVSRYPVDSIGEPVAAIPGDWNRDGAMDIWAIHEDSDLSVSTYLRHGDFGSTESAAVNADAGDAYLTADHNVDGWSDLYILTHNAGTWDVTVMDGADRFQTVLATGQFAGDADLTFSALDRDRDHVPDILGVGAAGSVIAHGASGFTTTEGAPGFSGPFDDIAGTDYDGDGRHDIATLKDDSLVVYAGNSALPGVQVTSWFEFPAFGCDDADINLPYPYEGTFRDDESTVHQGDINSIAETDITRGCNPPLNDEYCPERIITRGELAAFLARALVLDSFEADTFTDDDTSIFEDDIERLVGTGIVLPCNELGTEFCPDTPVDRDVMAQFLVAAFAFAPSDTDAFVDDNDSPHESDINAIAAVGVTLGCNPPANDMFCPERVVTRAEMASFMIRALNLWAPPA